MKSLEAKFLEHPMMATAIANVTATLVMRHQKETNFEGNIFGFFYQFLMFLI
jgi:hypothetical protein